MNGQQTLRNDVKEDYTQKRNRRKNQNVFISTVKSK